MEASDWLKLLANESVDCCITALDIEPNTEVGNLVRVFNDVRMLLKPQGTLWVVVGENPKGDPTGTPWMLAFALRASGWYLRQDIVWNQPRPPIETATNRCVNVHRYVFLLSKSGQYYFDGDAIKEPCSDESIARMKRGVSDKTKWKDGASGQTPHSFTQKRKNDPNREIAATRNKRSVWLGCELADIILPCVLAGCPEGGTIIDPFGGSVTAQIAKEKGRKYLDIQNAIGRSINLHARL